MLPTPFQKFCGYNDYKRKKEKKPRLSQMGLNHHVQLLSKILMQPWFCRSKYSQLYSLTEKLVEGMRKYELYLQENSAHNSRQQHSLGLTRSPVDNVIMCTIPKSSEPVPNEYVNLLKTMDKSSDYEPVFLNSFAPEDRYARRTWINKLQLPFSIFMYRYPHGNNLGTLNFAWKVPDEIDLTHNQHIIIAQLNNSQKLYFTRDLATKTSLKSKSVLRNIFRSLVNDESAPSSHVEAEVDGRLAKFLLDMDDPDIVLDLRKLNGKPSSSKFDAFWLELHSYIVI